MGEDNPIIRVSTHPTTGKPMLVTEGGGTIIAPLSPLELGQSIKKNKGKTKEIEYNILDNNCLHGETHTYGQGYEFSQHFDSAEMLHFVLSRYLFHETVHKCPIIMMNLWHCRSNENTI
jgi:hypothetical protein